MVKKEKIQTQNNKNPKNPGFFQYSYERVIQIAQNPDMGLDCVLAYLILASGVNSHDSMIRANKHWKNSVNERTNLSISLADAAISKLASNGFITIPDQDQDQDQGSAPFIIKCQVDPDYTENLSCLSQRFVNPEVNELGSVCVGSLKYLCNEIAIGSDGLSVTEARLDAIMTFLALHEDQDFDKFSGIDPEIIHSTFKYVKENHVDGYTSVIPINGKPDWSLTHVDSQPTLFEPKQDFSKRAFGSLQNVDQEVSIEVRFKLALMNLKNSGLLYKAHVLWNSNPIDKKGEAKAIPLYVVYVDDSWATEMEDALHRDIKGTTKATGTLEGLQMYGDKCSTESLYQGKTHGFIVDNRTLKSAVMLTVYRVRWWSPDTRCMEAIKADSDRTKEWRRALKRVVEIALNKNKNEDDVAFL